MKRLSKIDRDCHKWLNAPLKRRKIADVNSGNDVKLYRIWLDMTQSEFANYMQCGVASIKRWELGAKMNESSKTLIRLKIQQIFDCNR